MLRDTLIQVKHLLMGMHIIVINLLTWTKQNLVASYMTYCGLKIPDLIFNPYSKKTYDAK